MSHYNRANLIIFFTSPLLGISLSLLKLATKELLITYILLIDKVYTCTGLTNLPSILSSPVLLQGSSVVRKVNWASSSMGTFSRVNCIVVSFNIWKADEENKLCELA